MVRTAAQPEGLEELCLVYWRPIYGFIRRSGRSPEDAEDLTQGFFVGLIKDDGFSRAREQEGRLRSFLLGCLKRHLKSEWQFQSRQKRGGGVPVLPLAGSEMDFEEAEHHYVAMPVEELTPERIFEQRWVFDLLARAHRRLEGDYRGAGKGQEYELLKGVVMMEGEMDGREVARALKVKEATVRVMVHRLRRNFRAAFKEEIAQTVTSRAEVEEEYQRLLEIFS